MRPITRARLRDVVRADLTRSGASLRGYARTRGVNAGHLCQFLRHCTPPTPALLTGLGYQREESYVPAPQRRRYLSSYLSNDE